MGVVSTDDAPRVGGATRRMPQRRFDVRRAIICVLALSLAGCAEYFRALEGQQQRAAPAAPEAQPVREPSDKDAPCLRLDGSRDADAGERS
jgi:hypothetical protein